MMYADVVVNVPLYPSRPSPGEQGPDDTPPIPFSWVERAFSYEVPSEIEGLIRIGQLVWVPFGARRVQGIVIGTSDTTAVEKTRQIEEIVQTQPLLTVEQIELARWIARRYLAALAQCVWLFLPPGFEEKVETVYEAAEVAPNLEELNERQREVWELVNSAQSIASRKLTTVQGRTAEGLAAKGYLIKRAHVVPSKAKPRRVEAVRLLEERPFEIVGAHTTYALTPQYFESPPALASDAARVLVHLREHPDASSSDEIVNTLGVSTATLGKLKKEGWIESHKEPESVRVVAREDRGRRGAERSRAEAIVEFLQKEEQPVWISAVYAATGATHSDLRRLEKLGIVQLEEAEKIRDPLEGRAYAEAPAPKLTSEQASAVKEISEVLGKGGAHAFLLHGVTGSGKTEIYLNVIEEALKRGMQAIALVPEISLTPQTIRRFGARLHDRIGVVHSRLSIGERFDTWRRARDGKIDVIIGPRSALFAPLPRLGVIVIDEEHDASYKSDAEIFGQPSYHTREVALELARAHNAVVILGSATPDVETYFRAQEKEFKLLELPRRVIGHAATAAAVEYQELPPVEVVDMRAELFAENRSVFSRSLKRELENALARHEQAILFLNRRGSAVSVVCRTCGHVVKCPRCKNPFTLHQSGKETASELVCHHCGKRGNMPRLCPNCGSSKIRGLGIGTEKLEALVQKEFPGARTLRWDYDVTRGKEAHEQILDTFVRHEADVLIGTQMIAKGLDLPRVTLVGVVNADTGLHLPDFRASERTFQLLTQVAGRAGRSAIGGKAIIQTYLPEHYAIAAAAQHDFAGFYRQELEFRQSAAYPPFRPLTRLIYLNTRADAASEASARLARLMEDRIRREGLLDVEIVGPSEAFFGRLRGEYRYQILLKGEGARSLLATFPLPLGWRVDVDPLNLL